jgi:hypothetical protein
MAPDGGGLLEGYPPDRRPEMESRYQSAVRRRIVAEGLAVKPRIDATRFGSITIAGEEYEHDIVIRLDGAVKKRKKKLSKAVYGTSHTLSREEAKAVFEPGAERLIVGTGQGSALHLSDEAAEYFRKQGCAVDLHPSPRAIVAWNAATGAAIGLFHVTC